MSTARTKSLGESAAEIGGTPRWLADGIRAGRFPARKIGKSWRLTDADIDQVLEICKRKGAAAKASQKSGEVRQLAFTATSARSRRPA